MQKIQEGLKRRKQSEAFNLKMKKSNQISDLILKFIFMFYSINEGTELDQKNLNEKPEAERGVKIRPNKSKSRRSVFWEMTHTLNLSLLVKHLQYILNHRYNFKGNSLF